MAGKVWCETCSKATNRTRAGACRSCAVRAGGLARVALHGPPTLTPEQRREAGRRGGLARVAATTPEQRREWASRAGLAMHAAMTPDESYAWHAAGSWRGHRVQLGQAIARKRILIAALEAEVEALAG